MSHTPHGPIAQVITALALAFPDVTDGLAFTVGLPLASGAIAGVFAVLASQPADAVLTQTNEDGATLATALAEVMAQPDPAVVNWIRQVT